MRKRKKRRKKVMEVETEMARRNPEWPCYVECPYLLRKEVL
jgi:hypothetical protein